MLCMTKSTNERNKYSFWMFHGGYVLNVCHKSWLSMKLFHIDMHFQFDLHFIALICYWKHTVRLEKEVEYLKQAWSQHLKWDWLKMSQDIRTSRIHPMGLIKIHRGTTIHGMKWAQCWTRPFIDQSGNTSGTDLSKPNVKWRGKVGCCKWSWFSPIFSTRGWADLTASSSIVNPIQIFQMR